jgi:hypothetical protein
LLRQFIQRFISRQAAIPMLFGKSIRLARKVRVVT